MTAILHIDEPGQGVTGGLLTRSGLAPALLAHVGPGWIRRRRRVARCFEGTAFEGTASRVRVRVLPMQIPILCHTLPDIPDEPGSGRDARHARPRPWARSEHLRPRRRAG